MGDYITINTIVPAVLFIVSMLLYGRAVLRQQLALEKEEQLARKEKERQSALEKERQSALEKERQLPQREIQLPRREPTVSFNLEVKSAIKSLSDCEPCGANLWVIASGKGGVGKSLFSLGLLEYLSIRSPTALVDFDLHNRGITSLLFDHPLFRAGSDSLYELIEAFHKMLLDGNDPVYSPLIGSPSLPAGFSNTHYYSILERFSRKGRDSDAGWTQDLVKHGPIDSRLFQMGKMGERILVPGEDSLFPSSAYFLPSRPKNKAFLMSPVSGSGYISIFLFLRALCLWFRNDKGIQDILVDCHGAHDMFMAGAIMAAKRLIVVTTPEPSSLYGTFELVDTVMSIEEECRPAMALVVNCYSEIDKTFIESCENQRAGEMWSARDFRGVVGIPFEEAIRRISNKYQFGDIAGNPTLWQRVKTVGDLLRAEALPGNDAGEAPQAGNTN